MRYSAPLGVIAPLWESFKRPLHALGCHLAYLLRGLGGSLVQDASDFQELLHCVAVCRVKPLHIEFDPTAGGLQSGHTKESTPTGVRILDLTKRDTAKHDTCGTRGKLVCTYRF